MRTTLSLDDDVAALLERVQEKRSAKLKQVVNEALRIGLARMVEPDPPRERYRTPSHAIGRCLLPDLDNIAEVLAVAEGDHHR